MAFDPECVDPECVDPECALTSADLLSSLLNHGYPARPLESPAVCDGPNE